MTISYTYEGEPSPHHIELKKQISQNAVNGAGADGFKITEGMFIQAKRDNIIEYQPFGNYGYVAKGTVLEVRFATNLGYAKCRVVKGNAITWEYSVRIKSFGPMSNSAPLRERGPICGVISRKTVHLNTSGGYTDGGGPYALGSVNPELWVICDENGKEV